MREDLTRFCRDAPPEFTHPQRDVFCVFSGDGVQRLRDYLLRLAMEQAERDNHDPIDDSLLDGVESPGADTMSDDGTIDGNDQTMDISLPPRRISPFVIHPQARPRPRSLHELPSYHVEMPLFSNDQIERYGAWTPDLNLRAPHPHLMGSGPAGGSGIGYEHRSRSPAQAVSSDVTPGYDLDVPSPARPPSRRHTLVESSNGYFGPQPPLPPAPAFGQQPLPPMDTLDEGPLRVQRRVQSGFLPLANASRPQTNHLWDLNLRSASDIRQTYLRPDPEFSAFDANHEAIMSTIPGSRSASRHTSRSNSPHPSRVNSRSRLSNILSSMRTNPFSSPDSRGPFGMSGSSRSVSRSRREEEEHRQRMLQALAEADSAQQLQPEQQLRPDLRHGDSSRTIELPLLQPEAIERVAPTRGEASGSGQASRQASVSDESEDVTMGNVP